MHLTYGLANLVYTFGVISVVLKHNVVWDFEHTSTVYYIFFLEPLGAVQEVSSSLLVFYAVLLTLYMVKFYGYRILPHYTVEELAKI